jgi:hypothetical protein
MKFGRHDFVLLRQKLHRKINSLEIAAGDVEIARGFCAAAQKQRARREALFTQSAEDEKVKSKVLEEKFRERLKQTKDEPVTRPTRDIDLD